MAAARASLAQPRFDSDTPEIGFTTMLNPLRSSMRLGGIHLSNNHDEVSRESALEGSTGALHSDAPFHPERGRGAEFHSSNPVTHDHFLVRSHAILRSQT